MYKSFRVKNFRCFKDLQINDLGRVNLIAGKNNTGKTALMEAMYLHSGNRDARTLLRIEHHESLRLYREFMPSDTDDDSKSLVSWNNLFYNFETNNPIELTASIEVGESLFHGQRFDSTVTVSSKSVESLDIDDILSQLRIEDLERYRYVDVLEIKSDTDRRSTFLAILNGRVRGSRLRNKNPRQSDFLYAQEKIDSRLNAHRISNMRQSNDLATLVAALSDIEYRLKGLELLFDGNRPLIYADIGLSQLVPLSHLGDGMNRVASLILAMSEVPKGAIFIDEIENGIHYTVQKDVWKAIARVAKESSIQVFATTHNWEMIEAAHKAFVDLGQLDEFRFHRINRISNTNDADNVEAITYNKAGVEAFIRSQYEVRG